MRSAQPGPFPLHVDSTTGEITESNNIVEVVGHLPRRLRVMVACEYSGVVRDAFVGAGHDATSCDILPTQSPGPHIQADIRDVDLSLYDLLIAHPPCTYLSSARADPVGLQSTEIDEALSLIVYLMTAPVGRIAIENPVGKINSRIRKPDQIIHPWMFGDPFNKRTCFWLKNLPPLMATLVMPDPDRSWYYRMGKRDRGLKRSRTFPGIAGAMAHQWGCYAPV